MQHISHARAVGQVQFACALRHRLPAVAKVFRAGADRLSDGVDDHQPHRECRRRRHAATGCRDRAPCREVDERSCRARSCGIGWICGWPSSIRPGCGCRRRSMTTAMSTSTRPARAWPGSRATSTPPTVPRSISVSTRWPPRCVTTIRAPKSSAAPMPAGRWRAVRPRWPASAGRMTAPAAAERNAAAAAATVIHVLAEQATIDGTSDQPGYLPGFGILPAESVRELAATAHAQAVGGARRARHRIRGIGLLRRQRSSSGGVI